MGVIVIACYRPLPGRAEELLELVRGHVPALRAQDLATDREPIVMRANDGSILEVFEWASEDAVRRAHENPVVKQLWQQFEAVCQWIAPSEVAELGRPFSHFRPVDLA
ncbi:putative quinol monooxygenase [Nannocystis punicea]|uniref:Antibiotic biosynthesis monooxygenase n=1 Tax=Nannocystis punicea TaxID=2995304 RepID=A0ABY7GTU4_9BACT|nr:antibiotic biosynthesis monooxygenase [Nannocystis poenicansa]WAS90355.1 antibiotic biosynthesis monooxygenase [Nannocystis poenicansa]